MINRRKLDRWRANTNFAIHERETEKFLGHLADLSIDGMMIIGTEPIEPESTNQLRINFASAINDVQYIDLDAECIWCHKDSLSDHYGTGFRFKYIPPDKLELIDSVIQDPAFQFKKSKDFLIIPEKQT